MNKLKDDQWLDELIFRTINTEKPQFDAEKWKQKFPDEYKMLQSRATKAPEHSIQWTSFLKSSVVKFAAAAAIILVIGFFLGRDRHPPEIPTSRPPYAVQPETKLISMMSMRASYQRGGFEALDQQFRETLDVLGPRSSGVSMKELLEGSNGS